MDIEKGEYVRTNWGISKILANYGQYFIVDKNGKQMISSFNEYIDKEDIVKHSKNIIDLIEVGDYVNGMLVVSVTEITIEDKDIKEKIIFVNRDKNCTLKPLEIASGDIKKSIVTKEAFKSVEYVF